MDFETDEWLRTVAASAHGRETGELLYTLMAHRNNPNLQSYDPLLIRVREVLVTRYSSERANHLLRHLSVPRRDIIMKNTGNLPE